MIYCLGEIISRQNLEKLKYNLSIQQLKVI